MENKEIIFSSLARENLKTIYQYYIENASENIADYVLNKIIEKIESINLYPNVGNKEPFAVDFKFVLVYNYKIIFRLIDNKIYIADVFHTSQNPNKIIEII